MSSLEAGTSGKKVHIVSLGCSKNRVDSEVMYGTLQAEEHTLVDDPAQADVIVVNTCSFIQPATEESIETVLELARYKREGSCKKLVVTGCMVQRYGASLEGELPEVDHFLGTGEYHRIAELLSARSEPAARSMVDTPLYLHDERTPRVNSWSKGSAYLKISEGCNHACAFCIIPQLRGRLRSRTIPSLVEEARRLVAGGVRELNLVSQDSTAYGSDLRDGSGLGPLLQALGEVPDLRWIRLHYAYPMGLPKGFLEQLRDNPKVVKYVDIPLQHASGRVLRAMRRGVTREGQERILERIRSFCPEVTLRTTFIVGFPGETEEDFAELKDFVEKQQFDHVGVFTYFPEEGTPGATLPDQVPERTRKRRQRELLALQRRISKRKLKQWVGKEVEVLLEGPAEESGLIWKGRHAGQAPDVDGLVMVPSVPAQAQVGAFLKVRLTQSADYDLVGEPIDERGAPASVTAAELAGSARPAS